MKKAARYFNTLGYRSFALGNADGGLSNVKEKSLGAHAKSGHRKIYGLLKPGDQPPQVCGYLLDVVSDGEVRFGVPNINDNAEIVELFPSKVHTRFSLLLVEAPW